MYSSAKQYSSNNHLSSKISISILMYHLAQYYLSNKSSISHFNISSRYICKRFRKCTAYICSRAYTPCTEVLSVFFYFSIINSNYRGLKYCIILERFLVQRWNFKYKTMKMNVFQHLEVFIYITK